MKFSEKLLRMAIFSFGMIIVFVLMTAYSLSQSPMFMAWLFGAHK